MEERDGSNQTGEAARTGDPPDVTIHLEEEATHGHQKLLAIEQQNLQVEEHYYHSGIAAFGIGEYLQAYDSKTEVLSQDRVMFGPFQKLLRDASVGILDCNAEAKVGFRDDLTALVEPAHIVACDTENIASVEPACDRENIYDGYSAGEEFNEDNYLDANVDSDLDDCAGYEDDIDDCFGPISDSDAEVDNAQNDTSVEDDFTETVCPSSSDEAVPATVLGDCGCVSNHGPHNIGSDDEDDEDESDDEEEIIPVVDLEQEIYVNKAQAGVPYKKRKRYNGTAKRPNCRKARMMGAVERALRSSSTRTTEHIFEPIVGMVFDSREEAKEFYNLYSWEVGFGVKFNTSCGTKSGRRTKKDDINTEEEYRSMQDIVCQQSGYDDRVKNRTKRCGCPAKIHLLRTDDYGWYISSIVKEHNHPLSVTCGEKREWNSHRQIDDGTKEMIKHLRENNVPLTKIRCILGSMFGSTGDVPWTKRSLRTICNQLRRDQMDDDIRKTMEIFKKMKEDDPGFQFSVQLDNKTRIKTLMWCSGRSREQYACFGDVVTFDTTYCTNIYKMPFGLFVGVNNHFQTTIFAGVLMRSEKTKNFKWVFQEFLKLMGGKEPQTILTDQCKAMTKAVRLVLPNTYHLWCKWHVMKKIREGLGPVYTKDKKFRNEFWLIVNGMLSEEEFERGWADLVKRYGLENNDFMRRTYDKKKMWAKPWSKDKYCARMSSTQRSESANFMLKRFVPRNSTMNHFVTHYSRLLYDRDRAEGTAEGETKQLSLVHERLWALERHALAIYTKAAFDLFRKEVNNASNYIMSERDGNTFIISHDNPAIRARWARVHYKVEIVENGSKYICECGLYEHFGMLCCHAIRLMLKLDVAFIPDAHIMKRWTKDARDVLPEHLRSYQKDQAINHSYTFRHRVLQLDALELVKKGDMDLELFDIVHGYIKKTHKHADEVIAARLKEAEKVSENKAQYSSDDDEVEDEDRQIGVQSDGEALRCNKYGASGSSAGLSDSEILKMKAPLIQKFRGRPRSKRFMASSSRFKKKKANTKLKQGSKAAAYSVGLETSFSLLTSCVEDHREGIRIGNAQEYFSRDAFMKAQVEDVETEAVAKTKSKKKATKTKKATKKLYPAVKSLVLEKVNTAGQSKVCKKNNSSSKSQVKKKGRKISCDNCGLLGHNTAECYTAEVSHNY